MLIPNIGPASALRPRIVMFPASLRRNSHQSRLVEYFAALLDGRCILDTVRPGEVDLPLFNQDLESSEPVLDAVKATANRFATADAVIVAAPEYNGHVSPYLKNTFDWMSRLSRIEPETAPRHLFRDKPLLLTSASTGWTGGLLGLQNARPFLAYLGYLVVSAQICVSDADQWVAGDGFRFDPPFADHIARVLTNFETLVRGLSAAPMAEREQSYA